MPQVDHYGFWQRAPRVVLVSTLLLTLGSNCPTSLPPETGDIEVTILRAVDSVGQLCPITSVTWQIDPVAIPPRPSGSTVGTTARSPGFTNYSSGTGATRLGTPQFPIVCDHYQTFSGLAAGTWAVTGKAVRGNAFTCNKAVPAGGKVSATWVFNQGGTAESCN
jgi:hypothetical protein